MINEDAASDSQISPTKGSDIGTSRTVENLSLEEKQLEVEDEEDEEKFLQTRHDMSEAVQDESAHCVAPQGDNLHSGSVRICPAVELQAISRDGRPLNRISNAMRFVDKDAVAVVMKAQSPQAVLCVDVRKDYEFAGGHVLGAIHVDWRTAGAKGLARLLSKHVGAGRPIVIYCEFGGKRSPQAYIAASRDGFKGRDRSQLFVLHGGYSRFCQKYPELCDPVGGYVPED